MASHAPSPAEGVDVDRETAALELKERKEQRQREMDKLRDEVAMRAMVEIVRALPKPLSTNDIIDQSHHLKMISGVSYELADAMLEARKR